MERNLTLDDVIPLRPAAPINADGVNTFNGSDHWILRGTGGAQRSVATFEHDSATYSLPESARMLREQLSEDIPVFTTDTRARRRDHQARGTRVRRPLDYERFRHGIDAQPRFWTRYERKERRHTGIVTIACNFGIKGSQPTEHLEWRGAATLALMDVLESLGYRAHLFGVITSMGHPGMRTGYHVTIECKAPDARVSEQAMAILCDAGLRRVMWWSHLLSCKERVDTIGKGGPTDYRGTMKFDITTPQGIRTQAAAVEWVTTTVDALRARAEE